MTPSCMFGSCKNTSSEFPSHTPQVEMRCIRSVTTDTMRIVYKVILIFMANYLNSQFQEYHKVVDNWKNLSNFHGSKVAKKNHL